MIFYIQPSPKQGTTLVQSFAGPGGFFFLGGGEGVEGGGGGT